MAQCTELALGLSLLHFQAVPPIMPQNMLLENHTLTALLCI